VIRDALRAIGVPLAPTAPALEEVEQLGIRLENTADSLDQHLLRLRSTFITKEQFLLGRVQHGIDFAHFDELLLAGRDVLERAGPDATFRWQNATYSFAMSVERLAGAIDAAAPYRMLT
jgi:hypothetical protein